MKAETDFKLGEVLHWETFPQGIRRIHTATVVAMIEPDEKTEDVVSRWRATKVGCRLSDNTRASRSGGSGRVFGEKGYLLLTVPNDPARWPTLWAPEPSRLQREWIKAPRQRYKTKDGQFRRLVRS